jgi:hypothetical protein
MSKEVEKVIDRILIYFSSAEQDTAVYVWAKTEDGNPVHPIQAKYLTLPLSYFSRCDVTGVQDLSEQLIPTHERLFFDHLSGDITPSDLYGMEWDESEICFPAYEIDKPEWLEGKPLLYVAGRIRRVPLKEVRGVYKFKTGHLAEHALAFIYSNGTYFTDRKMAEYWPDGLWHTVYQGGEVYKKDVEDVVDRNINGSMAKALTNYYEWRVELGYPGRPTLGLITDPIGAREVFRLRDIDPGKDRRSALRHWVETHYRRKRIDAVEEQKIWAYLRGKEEFNWRGMKCIIHPSQYDLKKAVEYQAKRGKSA